MRLPGPFLKLPIRFDAEAIAAEVRALPPSAWTPHPTGFVGNEAVRLISPGGAPTDDHEGPMAATPALRQCAYVRQIMAEIGAVWGRSRLMGLAPGRDVPEHIDTHYYWRTHWRMHIPVITNPQVLFTCGEETVHMAAGECWLFDSFQRHKVENRGSEQRIHLVLDTVGGGRLAELIRAAQSDAAETQLLRPSERTDSALALERLNVPRVMSPWEMRCHLAFLADHARPDPLLAQVLDTVERFIDEWTAVWVQFGVEDAGRPVYGSLLLRLRQDLAALDGGKLRLKNDWPVYGMLESLLLQVALSRSQVQPAPASFTSGRTARA
jgi:hypothetical protein